MTRRFPLHIHLSTLFLALTLLVGGVIGWLGYQVSREILDSTARDLEARIELDLQSDFLALIQPAELAAQVLSVTSLVEEQSLEGRLARLPLLRELLNASPALTSLYVGYASGDFFMVRRLWNDDDRHLLKAPEQAAFLVQSIENAPGGKSGRFIFLDRDMALLRSDDNPDYAAGFDPRTRPWYGAAMAAAGQIKTAPLCLPYHRQGRHDHRQPGQQWHRRRRRRHQAGNPRRRAGAQEGNSQHATAAGDPGGPGHRLRGLGQGDQAARPAGRRAAPRRRRQPRGAGAGPPGRPAPGDRQGSQDQPAPRCGRPGMAHHAAPVPPGNQEHALPDHGDSRQRADGQRARTHPPLGGGPRRRPPALDPGHAGARPPHLARPADPGRRGRWHPPLRFRQADRAALPHQRSR